MERFLFMGEVAHIDSSHYQQLSPKATIGLHTVGDIKASQTLCPKIGFVGGEGETMSQT